MALHFDPFAPDAWIRTPAAPSAQQEINHGMRMQNKPTAKNMWWRGIEPSSSAPHLKTPTI
jgi:hypothetical protein